MEHSRVSGNVLDSLGWVRQCMLIIPNHCDFLLEPKQCSCHFPLNRSSLASSARSERKRCTGQGVQPYKCQATSQAKNRIRHRPMAVVCENEVLQNAVTSSHRSPTKRKKAEMRRVRKLVGVVMSRNRKLLPIDRKLAVVIKRVHAV